MGDYVEDNPEKSMTREARRPGRRLSRPGTGAKEVLNLGHELINGGEL